MRPGPVQLQIGMLPTHSGNLNVSKIQNADRESCTAIYKIVWWSNYLVQTRLVEKRRSSCHAARVMPRQIHIKEPVATLIHSNKGRQMIGLTEKFKLSIMDR